MKYGELASSYDGCVPEILFCILHVALCLSFRDNCLNLNLVYEILDMKTFRFLAFLILSFIYLIPMVAQDDTFAIKVAADTFMLAEPVVEEYAEIAAPYEDVQVESGSSAILYFILIFCALFAFFIFRARKKENKTKQKDIRRPQPAIRRSVPEQPEVKVEASVDGYLTNGTVLHGVKNDYVIKQPLGQGSFGITYLAYVRSHSQSVGNTLVALKEFYMKDINGRKDNTVTTGSQGGLFDKYRAKFAKEAQLISTLSHPGIVKVVDCFEANNTYYYAMEYIEGGSLSDYLSACSFLKESEALRYIRSVGRALSYMHKNNMLHLDIKPSNIMLKKTGEAVLIDFGLSKQYDENGIPESSTSVGGGTPGYAPIEHANYHMGNDFPVTMDVYALGATLFKMLTDIRPPEASIILNEGFPSYELNMRNVSERVVAAVEKAMNPVRKNRFQSVDAFLNALDSEETELG